MKRRWLALDLVLITAIAVWLVAPYFKEKYSDKWASIESTFVSDARFLRDHWPHPLWQPLWYGGTRFDYVYPPALRYGTAVITKVRPDVLPVKAYHIYVAFFYCLGIAGIYLWVVTMTGSRGAGWLAAIATALVSPSFLFIKEIRADAWLWTPQRLGVLVRYGEGPHITSLAVLGFALPACYLALRDRRPAMIAVAAAFCALATSNNFYGATSLALWFPLLVWSLWITHHDRAIVGRALAIVALSYGLTAFWLVPSYLTTTIENMRLVSSEGNLWSKWLLVAVGAAFIFASDRWARGRKDLTYAVFVTGSLLFFTLNVAGNHFLNFRVIGEPGRLIPEWDLTMILAAVELMRRLWAKNKLWLRAAVALVAAVSLATAIPYVRRHRAIFVRDDEPQKRVEYQISEWVAKNLPGERVLATGSLRFWINAWNDIPHMGGGSEQGLINQTGNLGHLRVAIDEDGPRSVLWLEAYGIDAAIVHGPTSKELYHDVTEPRKFDGVLPLLYDDGADNKIYRVPRRWYSLARVVDRAKISALPPMGRVENHDTLAKYVELVERGPDIATATKWDGTDALDITLARPVDAGQSVLAMMTYDPSWRAITPAGDAPTRVDALGQMLIDAAPGTRSINLVFELPLENKVGRAIFAFAVLACLWLVWRSRRAA